MSRREPLRRRKAHRLSSLLALVTLAAATAVSTGTAAAQVSSVAGGAFGASVSVSLNGAPITAGPEPSVTLPVDGGGSNATAPGISAGQEDASAIFGGRLLTTGELTVESDGSTGVGGSAASNATVTAVDALAGTLITGSAASSCTVSETDFAADTTLGKGLLAVVEGYTVELPAEPGPNTTFEGTVPGTSDTFTVILNDQQATRGSVTVTAVRIILHGPAATGEIALAQSSCTATSSALSGPVLDPIEPPAGPGSPPPADGGDAPVGDGSTDGSVDAPAESPSDGSDGGATGDITAAGGTTSSGSGTTAVDAADAAATGIPASLAAPAAGGDVTLVSGGAYGFYVKVGLFGGPANATGPEPTVQLPGSGEGSATPITASQPSGKAQYGPAVIFGGQWPESAPQAPPSGPLSVSAQGTLGPSGSVTTTSDLENIGPGPLIADHVTSTCTGNGSGVSGSVTFTGGIVETKYDTQTQAAIESEPIPRNPAPNYEVSGTIDHVGDSFRIVFNEQTVEDGVLYVTAAHMYLLGPIAKGDMYVGRTWCGINAIDVTPPTDVPPPSVESASETGGGGGGASSGGRTGGSGTGSGTGSGSGSGSMAGTGMDAPPIVLALVAFLAALRMFALTRPPPAPATSVRSGVSQTLKRTRVGKR